MAIDASVTNLGINRVPRWAFDSEEEYLLACKAEYEFIDSIESELAKQLNCTVSLPSTLVTGSASDDSEQYAFSLTVGSNEGLRWLQDSIRGFIGNEEINLTNMQFQHILKHSAVSGIYIPIDFPKPFAVVSCGDTVSVGSTVQLAIELAIWHKNIFLHKLTKPKKMQTILSEYEKNLKTVMREAEKEGKAIELI